MVTHLSSESLLSKTVSLVEAERKITLELILHLREIERRLLFAEMGFSSLFEFCTKHLGLSEGSAQRRISAMRLIRDLPEAKASIENGSVSLSNAAKLQSVFRAHKKKSVTEKRATLVAEEKRAVLRQIAGLSQRECEAKLFEILPDAMREETRERIHRIGVNAHELRWVVDDSFVECLKRLTELQAHRFPNGSGIEIVGHLLKEEIARIEKKKGLSSAHSTSSLKTESEKDLESENEARTRCMNISKPDSLEAQPLQAHPSQITERKISNHIAAAVNPEAAVELERDTPLRRESRNHPNPPRWCPTRSKRRAIPVFLKREVWKRANGRCEFPQCGSRYRLEIDHRIPIALGGADTFANLRLLCRVHNIQQANVKLGAERMGRYRAV